MQTGGAENRTTDLPISRRPTLPSEPTAVVQEVTGKSTYMKGDLCLGNLTEDLYFCVKSMPQVLILQ